eukprot:409689-Alexandrium_andersonii.AAC.1
MVLSRERHWSLVVESNSVVSSTKEMWQSSGGVLVVGVVGECGLGIPRLFCVMSCCMVVRLWVMVAVNRRSPSGSPGGVPVLYVKGWGWLSSVYQDCVSVEVRWSLRCEGSVVMISPESLVVVVESW